MSSPAVSPITISLAGGQKVDALVGGHIVRTDQPGASGGSDSAPAPFDLFLTSIGTCAGFFVQRFLTQRGLNSEKTRLIVRPKFGSEGALADVELEVELAPDFPAKYREALVRVIDQCSVKRAIQAQPTFTVKMLGEAKASD